RIAARQLRVRAPGVTESRFNPGRTHSIPSMSRVLFLVPRAPFGMSFAAPSSAPRELYRLHTMPGAIHYEVHYSPNAIARAFAGAQRGACGAGRGTVKEVGGPPTRDSGNRFYP